MNALVSIDVTTLTPSTVFAPGGVEAIVSKIEAEVSTEVFTLDTPEGRERIKSVAYKVARSKTALDDMGKELVSGIKAQAATIDAERRIIRDRLDALKEKVRGPLTAWEDAETDRVALHESALVSLIEAARFATPPSAATIRERILALDNEVDRDWQEFADRAAEAYQASREKLVFMRDAAEQAERDAAELAELRRLKSERDAADAAAEIEHSRVAHAAAAAIRQAEEDAARAEQEKAREIIRNEQAARDQAAAAARAVEDERKRVAAKEATERAIQEKREANKKHRAKVHNEIAAAILAAVLNEECAAAGNLASVITDRIAAGGVPHVSITY